VEGIREFCDGKDGCEELGLLVLQEPLHDPTAFRAFQVIDPSVCVEENSYSLSLCSLSKLLTRPLAFPKRDFGAPSSLSAISAKSVSKELAPFCCFSFASFLRVFSLMLMVVTITIEIARLLIKLSDVRNIDLVKTRIVGEQSKSTRSRVHGSE